MTEKERMLAGQLYIADDAELQEDFKRSRKLRRLVNATTEEQFEERERLFRQLLGGTGTNFFIETPFYCDYGSHIFIGENFYANYDCILLDVCNICIGKNVLFGPRVSVFTAGHPIDAEIRASQLEFGKPVTIGNDVWVGGNTVINPGVTIGSNVVIGSGSVVTKDIPSDVIAVGNPCKVLRSITEEDRLYWKAQAAAYWKSKENEEYP